MPEFVRSEFEGYVHCGVLACGFALLACPDCGEHKVVAFSCGGVGSALRAWAVEWRRAPPNLVDHVLPEGVPLRQYGPTLPFELRARIAYDRELMGGVGRIFVGTVLGTCRTGSSSERSLRGSCCGNTRRSLSIE